MKTLETVFPGDPRISELAAFNILLRYGRPSRTEAEWEFALEKRLEALGLDGDGTAGILLGLLVSAEIDRLMRERPVDVPRLARLAKVKLHRIQ